MFWLDWMKLVYCAKRKSKKKINSHYVMRCKRWGYLWYTDRTLTYVGKFFVLFPGKVRKFCCKFMLITFHVHRYMDVIFFSLSTSVQLECQWCWYAWPSVWPDSQISFIQWRCTKKFLSFLEKVIILLKFVMRLSCFFVVEWNKLYGNYSFENSQLFAFVASKAGVHLTEKAFKTLWNDDVLLNCSRCLEEQSFEWFL